jgi:hypothetical protein
MRSLGEYLTERTMRARGRAKPDKSEGSVRVRSGPSHTDMGRGQYMHQRSDYFVLLSSVEQGGDM